MSLVGSQQRTLIDLLAQLKPHWRRDRNLPARIQALLARNRSFGSRDRRLYRELIYTTLRFLPWVEVGLTTNPERAVALISWLAADSPATAHFRNETNANWPVCPSDLADKAALLNEGLVGDRPSSGIPAFQSRELLPDWLHLECPAAFEPDQLNALQRRAALWLRLTATKFDEVTAEFNQLGWRWQRSDTLPTALRMMAEVDVTRSQTFEKGYFEVQDLGSQLLLHSVGASGSGKWLDACAGAGGKTLQLATLLGADARIDAFDVRPAALAELSTRAKRARVKNVTVLSRQPTGDYDGVFVDAPCSGSGTWRRAPHLKWVTTRTQVSEAAQLQLSILSSSSERVRPGGRLIYATCSFNQSENGAVIAKFLGAQPEFTVERPLEAFDGLTSECGLTLLPAVHDTDGFFVSALRRTE